MINLKTYTGKKLVSLLKKIGFEVIRIKGSHYYLHHLDGRSTVVPVNSNEDIGIGLLLKILKDVDITKDELENI